MTDPLTTHQISAFKTKLNERFIALRQEISAELLSSDQEKYIELTGRVHDTGEAALADLLVDTKLSSINRHVQEIRDIDAALMRIALGSYGQCSDCPEPIAIERLEAHPSAERCIVCQKAHDRTFAHGGQPTL